MKHIRSVKFIRSILKIWIFLAFLAAIYTFKQEFIGFAQFEKDWLASDGDGYYRLYFIAGRWRKFSFFTDPVSMSYNMVMASILCIVLMLGKLKIYKRVILFLLVILFMTSMVYSGTRAAFPLVPIVLFLLAILKMNYKVLISVGIGLLVFVGLIFAPVYTPNMMRFQSAFRPGNDPSYNLRQDNQKDIQPFIQTHPFGGGLGSVGMWGARFSPNSYLSSFQPDSGYVRVAVELGWVGLFIICSLFFVALASGINNYYSIRDPELKNYCLAMILIVFALAVGNYPQEAIVQFPTSVYFYLFLALMHVTRQIDKEKHKLDPKNEVSQG